MQVTIDTKKDTKEEIKKAVDLLLYFVDEKKVMTNDPQDVFGAGSAAAMTGLFSEQPAQTTSQSTEQEAQESGKDDLGLEYF